MEMGRNEKARREPARRRVYPGNGSRVQPVKSVREAGILGEREEPSITGQHKHLFAPRGGLAKLPSMFTGGNLEETQTPNVEL